MVLCWSLWDWRGTLCTWVFVAGVALTDGAILLGLLWSVTGGRMLRAGGAPRQPA